MLEVLAIDSLDPLKRYSQRRKHGRNFRQPVRTPLEIDDKNFQHRCIVSPAKTCAILSGFHLNLSGFVLLSKRILPPVETEQNYYAKIDSNKMAI